MIDLSVLPARLPPIHTQQGPVTVERIQAQHAELLADAGLEAAESVQPWLGKNLCPTSLRSANQTIQYIEQQRAYGSGLGYLICFNKQCLGMSFINQINLVHAVGNLGYWLRPSACGQGLALAMCKSMLRLAFSQMSLVRLELYIEPNNHPSLALAKRLGAEKEGLCRKRIFSRDALLYSLVA